MAIRPESEPGGATGAVADRKSVERETEPISRVSMCFATDQAGWVLQGTDPGFGENLTRFYNADESDANERLVHLKTTLQNATDEQYWASATEGMAELAGAQYAFISKRILHSDHEVPVEMPPIGTKGSCLLGLSYYYNDRLEQTYKAPDECDTPDSGIKMGTVPDVKYESYAAPCAYMKHDKVMIIPGNGDTFTPHDVNPNAQNLICPMISYIGIPLFSEGKCFAHFGLAWGPEGERRRKLSWGYIETMLHSLEDSILHRMLHGSGFGSKTPSREVEMTEEPAPTKRNIVPHQAIAEAQSLKPYARSLSHELRTPMQGVVGMLDLMLATVQETSEGCTDQRSLEAFKQLKDYIESTQDSSRRAVEAADNVVHAYDMNMGLPDSAVATSPVDESESMEFGHDYPANKKNNQPDIVITGNGGVPFGKGIKRRRTSQAAELDDINGSPKRKRGTQVDKDAFIRTVKRISPAVREPHDSDDSDHDALAATGSGPTISPPSTRDIAPGLRNCNIRDLIQGMVVDSLKVGGRPDHAIAEATDTGEQIEVATQQPNGAIQTKHITWEVDPEVPETLLVDERDFYKCMSNLFSNAVKFTEEGSVSLHVKLGSSHHARHIVINIADSGPGIPTGFRPHLFKPFAREDASLTRTTEGLGLGLLVARSLARQKLHGDVVCLRTNTDGKNHGSEFEMRVPLTPADAVSRPATPATSPSPGTGAPRRRSLDSPSVAARAIDRRSSRSPFPSITNVITSEPRDMAHTPSHHERGHVHAPAASTYPQPRALAQAFESQARERADSIPRRSSIRPRTTTASNGQDFDRDLATKHPLNILVAEDNKINRKLLVSMLKKLGYTPHEAYDGQDAVRQVESLLQSNGQENVKIDPSGKQNAAKGLVDLVLMDLWMPYMDGYEATEKILSMSAQSCKRPVVLAVSADVTEQTIERVHKAGMKGFMAKPFQIKDIQALILQYAAKKDDWERFYFWEPNCIATVVGRRLAFMGPIFWHTDTAVGILDESIECLGIASPSASPAGQKTVNEGLDTAIAPPLKPSAAREGAMDAEAPS